MSFSCKTHETSNQIFFSPAGQNVKELPCLSIHTRKGELSMGN
ncbi:hypothetical protein EfmE1039_0617 [Enterococcus faecium E1039]|nr:hypothetical protein EfmE1039_0617 [Enterococcus faecium E1039]